MKTIMVQYLKGLILVMIVLISSVRMGYSAAHVTLTTNNCSVSGNVITFTAYITNDGDQNVSLNGPVIRMSVNPAIFSGYPTVTCAYIGNSDFPAIFRSLRSTYYLSWNKSGYNLDLTFNDYVYDSGSALAIAVGQTKVIGKFSITSSTSFVNNVAANLAWVKSSGAVVYLDSATTTTSFEGASYLGTTCSLSTCAPTSSSTSVTACGNYTWKDSTYATSGSYVFHTTNSTGCDSTITLVLTISPNPTVDSVPNQVLCDSAYTSPVHFSGSMSNTVYNWSYYITPTGGTGSGSGDIPSIQAINSTTSPLTFIVTVTPVSIGLAYIPNFGSNTVSVINTTTDTVSGTIAVGNGPAGVSVSPDGSRVYITNSGDNTVSVINTATETVTATITVGSFPAGVSVSPDGSKVYVANYSSGTVSVINTSTNTVTATITVGSGPAGVSLSPDGSRGYVANMNSNTVSVINTASNSVIATITVGSAPYGTAITPDGSKVYVTNSGDGTMSVVNTSTNTVTATITVGSSPVGVAISPDGSWVFVTDSYYNTLSAISTATNAVVGTLPVGSSPFGISVSPDGSIVYVSNAGSNTVSVITVSDAATTTVSVGSSPYSFGNFVAAGGCSGTPVSFNLTVNPNSTSSTSVTACNSYTWNDSTYTTGGDKVYHTSNATGCDSAATLHLTINGGSCREAAPIQDAPTAVNLLIYPNPNTGHFHLSMNLNDQTLKDIFIYDAFGKEVYSNLQTSKSDLDIDISQNAKGVYLIKVISEGSTFEKKIVNM